MEDIDKLLSFCAKKGYSDRYLDAARDLIQFCEEEGIDTTRIGQLADIHDTLEAISMGGNKPIIDDSD